MKQNIYNTEATEMLIIELNKFPKDWYKIKECVDKGANVNARNKAGHILKDYVEYYTNYYTNYNISGLDITNWFNFNNN